MLTVHHLPKSQSERIVWLCEELGIPYELKRYVRDGGKAPPEYKALHPCGTAPTITDDGLALGETGAIFDYILTKYGQSKLTVAPGKPDYAQYLFWLHYAIGTVHPRSITLMALMSSGGADSFMARAFAQQLDRAHQMMEQRLGEADYLGGSELTAADVMMVFTIVAMREALKRDLTPYPNIRAYLKRVAARPANQRASAKAEPDGGTLLS
jgi:glutathione S-transferase